MSNNIEDLDASNSNILYEATDLIGEVALILFEKDGKRFQLHVYDDYGDAHIMNLDRLDLTQLVNAISPFVINEEDSL